MRSRFKTLKPIRARTASEEAMLTKRPSDVALPDEPDERTDAIDQLARTPIANIRPPRAK